ncbi:hypothetical protein [Fulvivirga sp.]|uniref:hypothetical protein n=1 Tax=Fulvivirga sp. TaxID=1931237 RepID=UPI0032EB89EA
MKYKKYIGIALGAMYGVAIRLLMNPIENGIKLYDIYNLYSVTFIWITPIIIGIIPVILAKKEILESRLRQFTYPVLSVLSFFTVAITSRIEDWICLLILVLPFLIGAGLAGILTATIIERIDSKKLYSILFLPVILGVMEARLPNHKESFEVNSTIEINATKSIVWNYLIEVPEITNDEYEKGIFNFLGIPRPIKSQLEIIDGIKYRVGYFSDNLKLAESIESIDSLTSVSFKIHLDKSQLRDSPTDVHILKGQYFKFRNISYHLEEVQGNTLLTLKCNYEIDSKMNFYGNFWAKQIINDFEERLLNSLKRKIEMDNSEAL